MAAPDHAAPTLWVVLRDAYNLRFVVPVLSELESGGARIALTLAKRREDAESDRTLHWAADQLRSLELHPLEPPQGAFGRFAERVLFACRNLHSYGVFRTTWHPLLRRRWLWFLPTTVSRAVRLVEWSGMGRLLSSRLFLRLLRLADSPRAAGSMETVLRRISPDLVIVTPMIYPESRELDAVSLARCHGIPSVGLVLSWDNLTSKGRFHAVPDRLLVWNETQAREALELHGIPASMVAVTGAPVFDFLFEAKRRSERQATNGRDAIARRLGLPGGAPYVLYAGTSRVGLGPGGEVPIVERVVAELRARTPSPPIVVVRPHPRNPAGWDDVSDELIRIWPSSFPDAEETRTDFVDCVAHAAAVVALNTSLFIDAAVLDRPCVAISLRGPTAPTSLAHFDYLVAADFLEVVADERAAADAILLILSGVDRRRAERASFVESFVRPGGAGVDAAATTAAEILSTLDSRPASRPTMVVGPA